MYPYSNPRIHVGYDFINFCFNPHTREECDRYPELSFTLVLILIHASTKDVTIISMSFRALQCFNPRTSKGAIATHSALSHTDNFNPRIREGCDFTLDLYFPQSISFNPHTHKRVRPKEEIIFSEMSSTILIHTPVRGTTYFYVIHDILTSYFNPRTHEGCDKKVFLQ